MHVCLKISLSIYPTICESPPSVPWPRPCVEGERRRRPRPSVEGHLPLCRFSRSLSGFLMECVCLSCVAPPPPHSPLVFLFTRWFFLLLILLSSFFFSPFYFFFPSATYLFSCSHFFNLICSLFFLLLLPLILFSIWSLASFLPVSLFSLLLPYSPVLVSFSPRILSFTFSRSLSPSLMASRFFLPLLIPPFMVSLFVLPSLPPPHSPCLFAFPSWPREDTHSPHYLLIFFPEGVTSSPCKYSADSFFLLSSLSRKHARSENGKWRDARKKEKYTGKRDGLMRTDNEAEKSLTLFQKSSHKYVPGMALTPN